MLGADMAGHFSVNVAEVISQIHSRMFKKQNQGSQQIGTHAIYVMSHLAASFYGDVRVPA